MKSMKAWRFLGIILCAALSGCGRLDFAQARHLEKGGRFSRALKAYESFLARVPQGPREAEALVRAGRIYSGVFGRCDRAVPMLERAARMQGVGDWPARARESLLECPDLFPLKGGSRWTFVDTASGGRNMKLELSVSSAVVRGVRIQGAYYAGKNRFRGYDRSYTKEDWMLWEEEGSTRRPILRYPFLAGQSWTDEHSGWSYRIMSEGLRVRTRAGDFEGCFKVRSQGAGDSQRAWVYDYYCPGVGRVKTTIGTSEGEHPNTELSDYDVPAVPSQN